jgi:hypothetical protein
MFRIEITRAAFVEIMGMPELPAETARLTITSPFNGQPIIEFVLSDSLPVGAGCNAQCGCHNCPDCACHHPEISQQIADLENLFKL